VPKSRGDPRGVHYSASKAGVIGLTRAVALALAPHRIRVTAIAPGTTDTAQLHYANTEERGDVESRLKELHHGLEMDRTSCSRFWANQFRVLLTLAAYVLF
jgi:NAD(P)-dependent dehydrogenase (short-subunit alcohol dehydrogenase family)